MSGSRGVEKTPENSLDVKDWRGLWESTELDIGWGMEGEAREIGVFSIADEDEVLERGGGRCGIEEVDERLRVRRPEADGVVQLVEYWLANRDSASMYREASWNVR